MSKEIMSFNVAGLNRYITDNYAPQPGETISFTQDPTNAYDRHAIKVNHLGKMIGYVPAATPVQTWLNKHLTAGDAVTATIEKFTGAGKKFRAMIVQATVLK